MCDQTAGQGDKAIAEHESQYLHSVGVHTLCARHTGIVARRTDCAADLRAEEPVNEPEYRQNEQQSHRNHGKIARKPKCAESVKHGRHTQQGDVCLAHDAQVDRPERDHGQNAGQQRRNMQRGVQQPRRKAGEHPAERCKHQRKQRMNTSRNAHGRDGSPHGEAAFYGQIRNVQHTVADVNAAGHKRPEQS